MRVLVTGGGGFAGRHLLRALLESGNGGELAATVLGDMPSLTPEDGLVGVQWFSMDVTSSGSVREVVESFRPEVIYHLAGQASVGQSFDAPLETWEINATGTFRLLAILGQLPPTTRRLLLISSGEVYGVVGPADQPIGEGAAIRPVTPYGISKAAAELAALQLGAVGRVEVVIARSFNHIGPGQDERFVLPSMAVQLARMARGLEPPVLQVGNLEVERDFLDVRDVAHAYVRLMRAGEPGAAYNVCCGRAFSLLSVVEKLIALSGTGARLEVDAERVRPVDIPSLIGDPGRLERLGWRARLSLDETLRDLLLEAESRV